MSRGLGLALLWLLFAPLALHAGTVATSTTAEAQGAIRAIEVEGNRRVEPETVRTYLKFSVGDRYNEFVADQSLKALFSTGLFSDVRIAYQSAVVIVTVQENPVINQVAFEGNSDIDDKTLRAEVQLKSRAVFTRARVQADVQRILDVYSRQGLYAAQVEPKIIQLAQNRVDLVFEISEGPDTKVVSINFIGNRAFTDAQLEDVITTTENNWLSFLQSTDIYDPDRLRLDRELLRQFYLKNGYADARVLSATADLDRDGQGFFITFTLEEGELYTFGDIRVESSLTSIDIVELEAAILGEPGETYNAALIDKSIEKLTLMVAQQGFAFARVRPRADRDPIGRTIGVSYVVEEGPRVYIERINVYGNVRTRDYVIRREFRLAEGDAYNQLLVDRAQKRLQAMGFFKKVDVTREPGSASDRVVLNVNLVEQSTGELSFGGGWSTQEGLIADIGIAERNLMGRGQFLRLRFSGSVERFQVDLSFTEPRFLDRNISAGFDIFHKEVDSSSESSFRSRKTGAALRLGFPLAQNVWMNTRYNFTRDEVFDVEDDASEAVKQAEGENFISSLSYSVSYDTRNHARRPSKGLYFTLSQEAAGVGGDVFFVRTIAEGRGYYPIAEGVTLVGRVIAGNIFGWNGDDVRLIDSFFKGGETIRGFERAGFGPRDADGNDSLGGKNFYALTAEVRFPIPILPDQLGLRGAVFADAGSLWGVGDAGDDVENILDESSIRSSTGVSLMWDSPVGPLRADYAYVISSEDYDEEEVFRFGAQTQF